jgi:hypothetical protein
MWYVVDEMSIYGATTETLKRELHLQVYVESLTTRYQKIRTFYWASLLLKSQHLVNSCQLQPTTTLVHSVR